MLQNPCKTLGFKKNMVYKIPPGGGGKPYPASGLISVSLYYKGWQFSCHLTTGRKIKDLSLENVLPQIVHCIK